MLTKGSITYLRDVVAPQTEPLLSLYLDVNPAHVENAREAPLIRAKEAIAASGAPKSFRYEVVKRLTAQYPSFQARTLVLFAAEPLERTYLLHLLMTELPDLAPGGVLARWGRAFVAPLLHLVDREERSAAVFVDEERFRYFELFLGEIEEKLDAFRALDTGAWRPLREDSTGMPGVPARGGSGHDLFERRKDARTLNFYREASRLLEERVRREDVHHLLLMGPPEWTTAFQEVLPSQLRELVRACLRPPANPDASAHELLKLLQPSLARIEEERDLALLRQLDEGVSGIEATLEALQEGRVRAIAAPWRLDRTVYLCAENDYVAGTMWGAERYCPGGHHRLVLLQEILPDLAAAHGAELGYLRGEAATILEERHGGLAGTLRW